MIFIIFLRVFLAARLETGAERLGPAKEDADLVELMGGADGLEDEVEAGAAEAGLGLELGDGVVCGEVGLGDAADVLDLELGGEVDADDDEVGEVERRQLVLQVREQRPEPLEGGLVARGCLLYTSPSPRD